VLWHLRAQETKTRAGFRKFDIVAVRASRPEAKDAARGQQLLSGDFIQDSFGVIEKLPRLFTNFRIVEDCRISPTQFPDVKKWRPIHVITKIDNRPLNFTQPGQ